ncbi:MAG TPA: cation-translocating P-type ATPase [Syntrophomonadaceae bacterium]|nr:cation-translocating P-type ATPase [Syntrophomonadaceae bacterium]
MPQDMTVNTDMFIVSGVDCPTCSASIEKAVKRLPGVVEANLIFTNGRLDVVSNLDNLNPDQVIKEVRQLGYSISKVDHISEFSNIQVTSPREMIVNNQYFIPAVITGLMLFIGLSMFFFNVSESYVRAIFVGAIILGLIIPAKNGFTALFKTKQLDMNALMTIAVLGAMFIGELKEALVVVFLFAAGNFLQVYTFDRTRLSIRGLIENAPKQATVITNDGLITKEVAELIIGDVIRVKPGETISVDGTVLEGNSSVNQAPITGESIPVDKEKGSEVYAGTMNEYGSLEIRVDKLSADTTINKIINLVEEAQGQKAPAQQLIDKFASVYTPIVIFLALMVAVIPILILNQPKDLWLYQAFAVLLVACPCALVISTPVSIVSAIGNAAKNGILIKGGIYLEQLGKLKAIAFDKTGTLTQGKPEVTDLVALNTSEDRLIELSALIESRSEHPIAQAIISYNKNKINLKDEIKDFLAVPGKGAQAIINNEIHYLGNPLFLEESGIDLTTNKEIIDKYNKEGKTVVVLANNHEILGLIAISDTLRDDSVSTIKELKKSGIEHVIMLTGDNYQVAQDIASYIDADEFSAELLPQDKAQAVTDLISQYNGVAMVGDGINDAPALATSTVGIAMGGAGSGAALETADIALMSDNLSKLPFAIQLSQRTVRIIKQNILISLVIKTAILLLVIPGLLTMWLAVIADVGTSMIVTLNGMRLLYNKK